MAEETIQKKSGAERQAAFLISALEKASQNDGVLLNGTMKQAPRFYDKGLRVNPVNALVMAIHSDQAGYKTNSYVMFNDTKNRGAGMRYEDLAKAAGIGTTMTWRYLTGASEPTGLRPAQPGARAGHERRRAAGARPRGR